MSAPASERRLASLKVRLLSLVYEALIASALLLVATAVFTAVLGDSRSQPLRTLLQAYLLLVLGCYFVSSWTGGRRTLPMRTWRLRLVDRSGAPVPVRTAVLRFIVAAITLPIAAINLFWALLDDERLFLHDRIAGTRVVAEPPARAGRAAAD